MSSTIIAKNIQIGTSGTATNNFTWYQPAAPDGTVRLGVGNYGATTLDAVTVSNSGNVTVAGSLAGGALSGSSLAVSGAATTGSLTVNNNAISAVNSLGFRNRILNGGMVIDQRNAGASVTPANGQYLVDRFNYGSTQASKFTAGQNLNSVTPPTGFRRYLGFQTASAVSVGAGDFFNFQQSIEGFNWADMAYGTAAAVTSTLSFWAYSSLTGTFGGSLRGFDGSSVIRSYPFTYTIPSANTWTYITITIPGDTTASAAWTAAQSTTNGYGIIVGFGLGAGSTISGAAGSWSTNNFISATGATSVVGTNGATFYITGVQLEAGTVASPFQRVEYGEMLRACQRYYQELNYLSLLHSRTAATLESSIMWPVWMRAAPTFTNLQAWIFYDAFGTAFTQSAATGGYAVSGANTKGGFIYMDSLSGLTQGRTYVASAGSVGRIGLSAEL